MRATSMIFTRSSTWAGRLAVPLAALLAVLSTSCAPLDLHSSLPWVADKDEEPIPEKVVVFWSDTVMHQKGQPGVRGFGGRIFFYAKDDSKPIEVDGSLVVHAFDAEQNDPSRQEPEKTFIFTADQFQKYASQSRLGPSYSVWLPWGDLDDPNRNISLVSRFEGRDGGVVISEPANKLLPGTGTRDTIRVERS
ncbi:MAG: hypothetical protein FJ276_11825, partial [Planctomycetes bacterium]|nr:hypothetical protein [Planctomycetota bacterium]